MYSSSASRLRIAVWAVTSLLPLAAWQLTSTSWPLLHNRVGVFFTVAALISAAIGGLAPALVGALLNTAALTWFSHVHPPVDGRGNSVLSSILLVAVTLVVGYAREKWSAAEMLAGHLSTDLARLRDELASQRTDLKRFHELSVSLSSSLERQQLLNRVLHAIAALQKTDLAMLLLLPGAGSNLLRVETYAGFTAEQVRLFGDIPANFFAMHRRTLIEDIESPGTYFPFIDAATQVGFRAVFSAPIINSRGEPLGAVVTYFRKPHSPTERQARLVELYVRQAANALENARLYHTSLETLAAEQHRTAVLRSLAEASLQINSVLSLDSLLQVITDQARSIIGARQAFTTLLPKGDWSQSITCSSSADGQSAVQFPQERPGMLPFNKPVRITANAEGSHPLSPLSPWHSMMKFNAPHDGWLAAPLLTRDGRNLGLIQLSGKINGAFSEDDEPSWCSLRIWHPWLSTTCGSTVKRRSRSSRSSARRTPCSAAKRPCNWPSAASASACGSGICRAARSRGLTRFAACTALSRSSSIIAMTCGWRASILKTGSMCTAPSRRHWSAAATTTCNTG